MMVFLYAVTTLFIGGWNFGINIPVGWGFDITNFVWWIGIGHAGTLISASCCSSASNAHFDQSVAEAMTLLPLPMHCCSPSCI